MTTVRIISLFPELFDPFFQTSLLGKAVANGSIDADVVNLRHFGIGKYKTIDDAPYGGGAGMVIRPEPIVDAIESVPNHETYAKIFFSAAGRRFDQSLAESFSAKKNLMFVCGRYEGVDCRVKPYIDHEISVGPYVLMGGETAAMIVIEAVSRLMPDVLGNRESVLCESFTDEYPLEFDHYTRPRVFRGQSVPDELLSGNHKHISDWRKKNSEKKSRRR